MADLITLQEYKNYHGITNPKEDVKLSILISAVSNLIQSYVGTSFGAIEQITEVIPVLYDTDTLFTSRWPIGEILTVTEIDRYTLDGTVHVPLTHGADYYLGPYGSLVRIPAYTGLASWWPIGPSAVSVTYTAGHEAVPEDIRLATLELVKYYAKEEYTPSKTIQGSTIVNVNSKTDFPAHIQIILDNYKE